MVLVSLLMKVQYTSFLVWNGSGASTETAFPYKPREGQSGFSQGWMAAFAYGSQSTLRLVLIPILKGGCATLLHIIILRREGTARNAGRRLPARWNLWSILYAFSWKNCFYTLCRRGGSAWSRWVFDFSKEGIQEKPFLMNYKEVLYKVRLFEIAA